MEEKYILVVSTFDNEEEANKVVDLLLSRRLVSCCQMDHIVSKYHWKGEIETAKEIQVKMKTKKSLWEEVCQVIKENHSYETAQIVAYDIALGSSDYLEWIKEETI